MVVAKTGERKHVNWYKVQHECILVKSDVHPCTTLGPTKGAAVDLSGVWNTSLEFTAFGKVLLVSTTCHAVTESMSHQSGQFCVRKETGVTQQGPFGALTSILACLFPFSICADKKEKKKERNACFQSGTVPSSWSRRLRLSNPKSPNTGKVPTHKVSRPPFVFPWMATEWAGIL